MAENPASTLSRLTHRLLLVAVLAVVTATYANHFHNGFHFDDAHAVVDNPSIRSLANLPRFFSDTTTFSVLPANRTYRPFVSASLAVDYALGRGYVPFWFHLSTFIVFLLQLAGMYALYLAVLRRIRPAAEFETGNRIASLLAVAWYGLHPAIAETVNYIIQRGDIFSTAGVVAALALYVRFPGIRRSGLYLLPFAFGLLSKPPAFVFPFLLWLYGALFEPSRERRLYRSFLAALPSLAVCIVLLVFESAMTPKSYAPSVLSAADYRMTQPFVLLRYFGSLFLPVHLNVDTDLTAFHRFNGSAFGGFLFVIAILVAAWLTARKESTRPIAFGLFWFLITSVPTSFYVLSEVENDHRMYFPFVGLVFAVVWSLWLAFESLLQRVSPPQATRHVAFAGVLVLLAVYAFGTYQRNRVWRTDESLWKDDVAKSPHNGRGLMNYGLTQMAKGAYPEALDSFQRALLYTPNYSTLEINLGVLYGVMFQAKEAAQHFQRAIQLAPGSDESHYFYGRWLYQSGDLPSAIRELETATRLNPSRQAAQSLLTVAQATGNTVNYWVDASLYQYRSGNYAACIADAQKALDLNANTAPAYNNIGAAYAALQQWDLAIQNEREALRVDPSFAVAKNNLEAYTQQLAQASPKSAEDWLNLSLHDNQAGLFQKSIQDAREALKLRPDYAEAYNNIAAGYEGLHDWDRAIEAAQKAVSLKPDFQLAKNNLAWAQQQRSVQPR
ncbi:tetratricopeptide repeat protein [Terriglobus albidus]|uniref:Tetratricopeptide repeat protein n=1 Tax=Terriglobus albidus TaxID=1592106 RepID=A0A5B9EC21_9BACT|nr:tetratricopeptide repeat protein [Terriglobus albidus]QEE28250.1 tetratricopeptide repeat protein [Terriglobus albidus]